MTSLPKLGFIATGMAKVKNIEGVRLKMSLINLWRLGPLVSASQLLGLSLAFDGCVCEQ